MTAFPHFMRSRRIWLFFLRWQRHGLFILGGITVGAAAVGLTLIANYVMALFQGFVQHWRYGSLVVTPLGLGLAAYLAKRFFPNS